jgi:hypothetical protein
MGTGDQQGAVVRCLLIPHEGGDDGKELVLAATGRADGRGRVKRRRADHLLVQVRLVPADADEGEESAAQPLGGRPGAVTTRRPRTRYTIGRDAALITRLPRILPDRTLDRVISANLRRHYPKAASV